MKIKLSEIKTTFSGRTLAEELVLSFPKGITEIDFSGVESITQGFASEFIRSLISNNFNIDSIIFSNMNDRCLERINAEKARIKLILSKK